MAFSLVGLSMFLALRLPATQATSEVVQQEGTDADELVVLQERVYPQMVSDPYCPEDCQRCTFEKPFLYEAERICRHLNGTGLVDCRPCFHKPTLAPTPSPTRRCVKPGKDRISLISSSGQTMGFDGSDYARDGKGQPAIFDIQMDSRNQVNFTDAKDKKALYARDTVYGALCKAAFSSLYTGQNKFRFTFMDTEELCDGSKVQLSSLYFNHGPWPVYLSETYFYLDKKATETFKVKISG